MTSPWPPHWPTSIDSTDNFSNREFHQFVRLPPEIRDEIWKLSLTPRVINIEKMYTTRSCRELTVSQLVTCRESRQIALKSYEPWGHFRAPLVTPPMAPSIFGPSRMNLPQLEPRELMSILPRQESFIRRRENFFSWCYVDFAHDVFAMKILEDDWRPCHHSLPDVGLDRIRHLAIQLWESTPFEEYPWRPGRQISGYQEATIAIRFSGVPYFFRNLENLAVVLYVEGACTNIALEKVSDQSFVEERDLIRGFEKDRLVARDFQNEEEGFEKEAKLPETQFVKIVKIVKT